MKTFLKNNYGIYPLIRSHPSKDNKTKKEADYYIKRFFSKQLFVSILFRIRATCLNIRYRKKDIIYI